MRLTPAGTATVRDVEMTPDCTNRETESLTVPGMPAKLPGFIRSHPRD